jgi:hypothetical protein
VDDRTQADSVTEDPNEAKTKMPSGKGERAMKISDVKIGDRVVSDVYKNGKPIQGTVDVVSPALADCREPSDPARSRDAVRICQKVGSYSWAWIENVELVGL